MLLAGVMESQERKKNGKTRTRRWGACVLFVRASDWFSGLFWGFGIVCFLQEGEKWMGGLKEAAAM